MPSNAIYISGPMRGVPEMNFPRFNRVAAELRADGHLVLNPAEHPAGLTDAEYMDIDLALIRACDKVFMLPGWSKSKGACVEHAYAEYLNRDIIYGQEEDFQ
jgi:hypothetical protein